MSLVKWDDSYSVNVEPMDGQHIKVINMINNLHEAISHAHGQATVGTILDELIEYTKTHLVEEEQLLIRARYPRYVEHKAIHDKAVTYINELYKRYIEGHEPTAYEILHFLRSWFIDHILDFDKDYGRHITSLVKDKSIAS